MFNADEILQGMDLPDDSKAKLSQKLSEINSKHEAELSEERNKLKDAIDSRQKTKDEIRELREKFVNGEFDGKKELEAALKLKDSELASYNEKIKTLETDLQGKSEELKAIETETRETLKERFSEGKWEVVKDLPLPKIRELAKMEAANEPPPSDKSKTFKTFGVGKKDLNAEEKIATLYGGKK